MPLPANETAWPPNRLRGLQKDFEEWAAWYAGDTTALSRLYGGGADSSQRGYRPGPTSLVERLRFWGRRSTSNPASRMRYHVPAASDIAATSADLLFGDAPTIRMPEADAKAASNPTQERFDEIRERVGFDNILLEGAEVCAAIGGSYLRPAWDKEVSDFPMLDIIHADAALPEFHGDRLFAVTFHNIVHVDGNVVFRKLERHEPGVIFTGLYSGSADNLGKKVSLETLDETADLAEVVSLPTEMAGRILVEYVPNVRPHRKYRSQPQGRADFSGAESLMDALDETYTSWMRDIRLGQARLVVSEDALTRGPRGMGATFDGDQELFTKISSDPGHEPLEQVQFEIRSEQHMATALNLFEKIVSTSGYSPQTFGMEIDGNAPSGTALRVREKKSLNTRARKARYWVPAIATTVENMLLIDRFCLGNTATEPARPMVELADAVVSDPMEQAQTISMLRQAQAASIRTAVRMAQPELSEDQLNAEVAEIKAENAVAFDPTGGFP